MFCRPLESGGKKSKREVLLRLAREQVLIFKPVSGSTNIYTFESLAKKQIMQYFCAVRAPPSVLR